MIIENHEEKFFELICLKSVNEYKIYGMQAQWIPKYGTQVSQN